ncbi:OmpA family protein [Antarctobacter heliothermus]|uniref:Outer membrane protein OmpA n=1 Tax=Antarctobacter heliothermus TaxID=74033 RepID=A0A239E600_9RHOB|nr:OmpA family protein [Antarctobacter heliothermus]SNS40135.1 Outer membrane protein OmpA [Antarctobacter heliothermus]
MIRAKSPILLSVVAVLGLSACTTGPMVDDNDPNKKAKQGALIGALGGAVAGRLAGGSDVGERNRATVAGALVGAAAGAAIGNQLDKQEAELRQQLGDSATIRNTGDRLIVTMPQDILFATDSAQLRSTLVSDLRDVGQSLLAYPNTTSQVIGHTDSDGAAAYNQDLSQRRAQAVANVLLSEGVPRSRVSVIGRGEDQPIASNLTAEGKAQNRRVEIVILPNG